MTRNPENSADCGSEGGDEQSTLTAATTAIQTETSFEARKSIKRWQGNAEGISERKESGTRGNSTARYGKEPEQNSTRTTQHGNPVQFRKLFNGLALRWRTDCANISRAKQ
jgi:hypothetical protein